MKNKKLLFVVNSPQFFLSHRLPVALAAKSNNYEVHVASAEGIGVELITSYGLLHHIVAFSRSGQNPIQEMKTLIQLIQLFKKIKPDLIHLITIKPVLYGGIAARLTSIKAVVAAISGLGTIYIASSFKARLRRWLVTCVYRVALSHSYSAVIFQNPEDRDNLLESGVVQKKQVRMIRGSGVSMNEYRYIAEPEGAPVVVMAARLLNDKGVCEYVEAARILRKFNISMRIIGSPDFGNPTSVTQEEIETWSKDGSVQLLGYCENIAEQYAAANIVCLPSYREGLPKCLAEAAACGRAVVTTNVPGCRDAITPDTGVLVPVRDSIALADAILDLVQNPEKRKAMGKAGRELAEREFAIEKIVDEHMQIYNQLISKSL
jgi:glycosyltransferase involved in cell wall biosynthesis